MPLIKSPRCCNHGPVRFAKVADLAEVERLALQYEPTVASALNILLDAQADALDLDALTEALKTGDISKVLAVIDASLQGVQSAAVVEAVQNTVWAAGAAAAVHIPPPVKGIQIGFNRLNPKLITFLQQYSLGMIKQIGENTKEAVRDVLIDGMTKGQSPLGQAVKIKDTVGLTSKQSKAVANFRAQLEDFHLKRSAKSWKLGGAPDKVHGLQVWKPDGKGGPKDGMLERRLRDFRYDKQLAKAMETGTALKPEQIDKMVAAYARKYRAYRAKVIARTEALRAAAYGTQDAWRQAIDDGKINEELVVRRWIVSKDERTCEVCSPIPGMNEKGVAFGQPFATPDGPQMLPPIHPQCRCSVFIQLRD